MTEPTVDVPRSLVEAARELAHKIALDVEDVDNNEVIFDRQQFENELTEALAAFGHQAQSATPSAPPAPDADAVAEARSVTRTLIRLFAERGEVWEMATAAIAAALTSHASRRSAAVAAERVAEVSTGFRAGDAGNAPAIEKESAAYIVVPPASPLAKPDGKTDEERGYRIVVSKELPP